MRAVRFCNNHVHLVDVPNPQGDGIRVKIVSAGICGTDLHLLKDPNHSVIPGHELGGILPDGRLVAIEPIQPCGKCEFCVRGDYNLCAHGAIAAMGSALDGGMAEEVLVPARCIAPLPSGFRAEDGCLVEPMAVATRGMRLAGLKGSIRVAVIGGGAIGQCAAALAVYSGARTAMFARHNAQKEAALKLGAVLDEENQYDLVVEAAGTSSAVKRAVQLCRHGGTILMLAAYWDGLQFPGTSGFDLLMKEIRIIPSLTYGQKGAVRDFDTAASMLGRFPEIARTLITHRFPLDAVAEAFATAADRAKGAIKVVLEP